MACIRARSRALNYRGDGTRKLGGAEEGIGFCVLAGLLFDLGGGAEETLQLQKDVAIAGGFLVLALFGAGPWSIDEWRGQRE